MCGIAGFANYNFDKELNIKAMMNRMLHRGPDAGDYVFLNNSNLVMGHRRLAIIDISCNGAQPMTSHNGRYTIVYNGEIYNHTEIKDMMLKDSSLNICNSDFKGTSDTEILLEAISAYGFKEAVSLCKGMFAIACYDNDSKELYLSRDRVGEKPLYYGRVGDAFVFCSDVGSIASLEGFNNEINDAVLGDYFIYGYIPAPFSIYRNISKLIPGTILKIKAPFTLDCDYEIEEYWSMKDVALKGQNNLFKGSYKEATDELDRLLRNSIKGQMISDVPLGAFLSAGIDSSTTVSLMQQLSDNKVKSFTIGMEDPKYNEATYAKEIARHLGTEHTELYITEEDAKAVIPKLPFIFGEPFADSSQIPTYLVSKMTKEHVTVSLSGDGGDELFCGYTSYNSVSRIWNKMKKVPKWIRKPVGEIVLSTPLAKNPGYRTKAMLLKASNPKELYLNSMNYDSLIGQIALNSNRELTSNDILPADYLNEINHNMMLMDMLMYHPDDILVKVDRCAMACSLETRVPMLDKDVIEFAWTLPIDYLYDNNAKVGKKILRDVLYRYVPKELMDRPKKGFSIPIKKWLKEDPKLRQWATELLDSRLIKEQGFLNSEVVSKLWNDFIDNGVWRVQIWYILMFQSWLQSKGIN